MIKARMTTFNLIWRNWHWLRHIYICCISQCIIKILFKRDGWFWRHFVPNLLRYRYMHADNYFNIKRCDKVKYCKIKQCTFYSQCIRIILSAAICYIVVHIIIPTCINNVTWKLTRKLLLANGFMSTSSTASAQ